MSDIKEEVLIDINLHQDAGAFARLAELKTSITTLKEEQKNLAAAYKAGNITLKEYADETVRVDAMLKKTNATYTEVQRSVTGLKSHYEEMTESLREHANEIEVAGIGLKSFINPVTATIAVLGGLYEFYEKSSIGAKDLEFASAQLGSATHILANNFAELFSSSKEGEGFFSKLTSGFLGVSESFLSGFSILAGKGHMSFADEAKEMAKVEVELNKLGREEIKIRADMSDRLESNQDKLITIGKLETSYSEKLKLQAEVVENLKKNQEEITEIKTKQLNLLKEESEKDINNNIKKEIALTAAKDLNRERARAERLIRSAAIAEDNIKDTETKRIQLGIEKKKQDDEKEKHNKAQLLFNLELESERKEEDIADKKHAEALKNQMANEKAAWAAHVAEVVQANEEMDEAAKKAFEEDKKRQQQKAIYSQIFLREFSGIFQQQLAQNKNFEEALLKSFLITSLHAFKKYIELKILGEAFSSLDSIATFGLSGSIKSAVIIGLVEAAFSGFEGIIQGFAQGGRITNGTPIRRSNGDDVLITAKRGEVILNERHQAMLGGERTFQRMGIPGYATSGVIGFETQRASTQITNDFFTRQMLRAMQQQKIVLPVDRLNTLQQQLLEIKDRATI